METHAAESLKTGWWCRGRFSYWSILVDQRTVTSWWSKTARVDFSFSLAGCRGILVGVKYLAWISELPDMYDPHCCECRPTSGTLSSESEMLLEPTSRLRFGSVPSVFRLTQIRLDSALLWLHTNRYRVTKCSFGIKPEVQQVVVKIHSIHWVYTRYTV